MPTPVPSSAVRPSIMRILAVDLPAFSFSALPLLALGMYLFLRLLGGELLQFANIQIGLAAMVVVGLGGAAWRIILFHRVFAAGLAVQAVIDQATVNREQCVLQLGYTYAGKPYTATCRVLDNKTTHLMRPGERLTVLVDPRKPKRVFIQTLFL